MGFLLLRNSTVRPLWYYMIWNLKINLAPLLLAMVGDDNSIDLEDVREDLKTEVLLLARFFEGSQSKHGLFGFHLSIGC